MLSSGGAPNTKIEFDYSYALQGYNFGGDENKDEVPSSEKLKTESLDAFEWSKLPDSIKGTRQEARMVYEIKGVDNTRREIIYSQDSFVFNVYISSPGQRCGDGSIYGDTVLPDVGNQEESKEDTNNPDR